ncbi:hypothetical protein I302_108685 [Kwoniella bestiolae CBS 10118]|uniref:Uncharacterized protein n=1 Tax=Kwoniella bestiolae CBS 10118 TaxID=1296100 RepID=A0A1B9FTS0_9TREE|nr:hypothetical protein I302_07821 [Kwoniella bestiolae CBS 10118]OCF22177.1 hypothetical protein I302_07821 [Kwoniella bestiolae CBS 10118]
MNNERRGTVYTQIDGEEYYSSDIPWTGGGTFAPWDYPNPLGRSEADRSREIIDRLSMENARLSMENARLSHAYHSALAQIDMAQRHLRDLDPPANWEISWIPTATRIVTEMISTSLATKCLEYHVGPLSNVSAERDRVQELSQTLFGPINSCSSIGSIIHQSVYQEIMKRHDHQEGGGPGTDTDPIDRGVMDTLEQMFTTPQIMSSVEDEARDPSERSCWVLLATGNGKYERVDLPTLHEYSDIFRDHVTAIYRSRVNTNDVWAVD